LVSAEKGRRVARRMVFSTCIAGSFTGPDFCLIFAPRKATMSQKSSLPQPAESVSRVLTADTCGSEGTYDFWGPAEKTDLYDLIERVAAQPWCNGEVGMIGVSYFAIEQYRAALQRPPHLRAIFPFSGSTDFYREAFWHGGMFCDRFVARFFAAIGMLSRKKDRVIRPLKPGKARGGKGPDVWCAFGDSQVKVI